jgi:hypothetical protein
MLPKALCFENALATGNSGHGGIILHEVWPFVKQVKTADATFSSVSSCIIMQRMFDVD